MPTRIIFGPQPPASGHGPALMRRAGEIHDEIEVAEPPDDVLEALGKGPGFAQFTQSGVDEDPVGVNVAHVQRFREVA